MSLADLRSGMTPTTPGRLQVSLVAESCVNGLDLAWEEYDPFEAFNNREYFGSVTKSFFTLFQARTCGQRDF